MCFQGVILTVSFLFMFVFTGSPCGLADVGGFSKKRFVITELQPVIDPQMERVEQVYMCAEARIRQFEMEPSPKGGITKTRVAVRPAEKGSVHLKLDASEPGYRLYQVFTRGLIQRALSWAGAEHVLIGPVSFAGYHFQGDPAFPLHFKLVPHVGYVHLCGRGTVETPNGTEYKLESGESIYDLLSNLTSIDQLAREAACTALGYVVFTSADRDKVVPALVALLKDDAMEVRRNAAEALGRLGDPKASEALKAALKDEDDWVREVVGHALEQVATGKKIEPQTHTDGHSISVKNVQIDRSLRSF